MACGATAGHKIGGRPLIEPPSALRRLNARGRVTTPSHSATLVNGSVQHAHV
jgi:hypothetical protein